MIVFSYGVILNSKKSWSLIGLYFLLLDAAKRFLSCSDDNGETPEADTSGYFLWLNGLRIFKFLLIWLPMISKTLWNSCESFFTSFTPAALLSWKVVSLKECFNSECTILFVIVHVKLFEHQYLIWGRVSVNKWLTATKASSWNSEWCKATVIQLLDH